MKNNSENPLVAEQFLNDPRLAQAKALIIQTLSEYRNHLKNIRPPHPSLKQSYEQTLAAFAEMRGGNLWYPYLGSGIGNGALVELADGSVKYDFICGVGPHYWGHSDLGIVAASIDASVSNTLMQGHLQQNQDAVTLTKLLLKASGMDHCFLTTSGAMAVENGLKIAFQKKHPAGRLLAFERCFMGRSLASSQITDKPSFREGLPTLLHVDYIPFYDPQDPEGSLEKAIAALHKHLSRYPKQHAAMCFELIQGEGGFYVGTTHFFEELMKILRKHEVPILIDEIQTFGRTPELFAYQYFALQDYVDIVTIGKLSQTCATLYRSPFKPRPGLLSQTFTASTSAIRAAIYILGQLMNEGYLGPNGKIAEISRYFIQNLEYLAARHPTLVRGPFGAGAMVAFTPYDGSQEKATQFAHALFEAGVISFIAGSNPTRIRFLLPMGAITFTDIDNAMAILEDTLITRLW